MNANAFSSTTNPEGPVRAQEILGEMNERYLDGADEIWRPTAKSIRVVVKSWIRSSVPDKMEKAERVLDVYEDLLDSLGPSDEDAKDIFESMLFGWAQQGADPEQAQVYLELMIEKGFPLDSFCFDKVIEANTQLNDENAFKRSTQVFELMETCRKRGDVKPNERVYTSFIRAMTKARVDNLAQKALLILQRMEQLGQVGDNHHIKPTVFAYNAVLMACAETASTENEQEHREALKIALGIFKLLREERKLDHVSFANMLRCACLLPAGEQRDALVKSTFQLCCKAGFVNQFVLRDLKSSASPELWQSLLQRGPDDDEEILAENLPPAWRHKFTSNKKPQQKRTFGRKSSIRR
jgi:hypothetical protein